MKRHPILRSTVPLAISLVLWTDLGAQDDSWARFRGPNGGGIANGEGLPAKFGADANLIWKTPLPGGGSSSPVVAGGKIFVTCYTGYGLDKESPGEMDDLRLHLLCIDQASGEILWKKSLPPKLPELPFKG